MFSLGSDFWLLSFIRHWHLSITCWSITTFVSPFEWRAEVSFLDSKMESGAPPIGNITMPDVVKSLWIGAYLPLIQRLSIQSFLQQGHAYQLYAYGEIDDVPTGTKICDASDVLSRDSIFRYQEGFGKGSYSAFSNLFRYKLLFEQGGWWVDTDVVCLKPFDFEDAFVFATEHTADHTATAASCVIKSPAGSDYLRYCLDVCNAKDKAKLVWREIGPSLMDDAINRFNLHQYRAPAHVFNPIDYFQFTDILAPDFDPTRLTGSYAVHLWNQKWRSHHLDPEDDGPPQSLYALLRKRYLGSVATDPDPEKRLRRKVGFLSACVEDLRQSLADAEKVRDDALRNAQQEIARVNKSLLDAQQEIIELRKSLEDRQHEISGLRNSISWRMTAPLRAAYDRVAPRKRHVSSE